MSLKQPISTEPAPIPLDSATKQLLESLVTEAISSATRSLKIQVNAALDALETQQRANEFSLKQINMRINALSGHVEKKKKSDEWSQPMTLDELIAQKKAQTEDKTPTQNHQSGPGKRIPS